MTPLSKQPVPLTRRLFLLGYVVPLLLVGSGFWVGYVKLEEAIARAETARLSNCAELYDLRVEFRITEDLLDPERAENPAQARKDAQVVFRAIPRRLVVDGQRRRQTRIENLALNNCEEE